MNIAVLPFSHTTAWNEATLRSLHALFVLLAQAPANTLPGRDLPSYLALPLDEYSLLDPTWISRPDPEQPNMFLLKASQRSKVIEHVLLETSPVRCTAEALA